MERKRYGGIVKLSMSYTSPLTKSSHMYVPLKRCFRHVQAIQHFFHDSSRHIQAIQHFFHNSNRNCHSRLSINFSKSTEQKVPFATSVPNCSLIFSSPPH